MAFYIAQPTIGWAKQNYKRNPFGNRNSDMESIVDFLSNMSNLSLNMSLNLPFSNLICLPFPIAYHLREVFI